MLASLLSLVFIGMALLYEDIDLGGAFLLSAVMIVIAVILAPS